MLIKLLGNDWKAIGLSLEDSLDIPIKKLKEEKFKEEPKKTSTEGDMR